MSAFAVAEGDGVPPLHDAAKMATQSNAGGRTVDLASLDVRRFRLDSCHGVAAELVDFAEKIRFILRFLLSPRSRLKADPLDRGP
jgi:hypothetical protein